MPKQKSNQLLQLVESLSPTEKRGFRLFVSRNNHQKYPLFMKLFDFIDKSKNYDESRLLELIPEIKKSQLSNLKANLFEQLLLSLRQLHRNKLTGIKVRESLDFSKILYSKGLYSASLSMLEKAKKQAINSKDQSLHYTALSFEKHIESMYVTGSMSAKAMDLSRETDELIANLVKTNKLSNFSLLMYGLYLKIGYAKNENEFSKISSFFVENMPSVDLQSMAFYDKLYWIQSHMWFYYMTHDFVNYYRYAKRWSNHFDLHPEMKKQEASLHLKGRHNVLNSLFIANQPAKFSEEYKSFISIEDAVSKYYSANEMSNYHLFKNINFLNQVFLTANYDEAYSNATKLEELVYENPHNWDRSRLIVFKYKIACIYFGCDDLERTIIVLNKITNKVIPEVQEDIQCFARILNLIAHFDLGNEILVSYQVKSTFRFLTKMKELQQVHLEILKFLRRTPNMSPRGMNSEFANLKSRLQELDQNPFETRPFLYLDIISWLESKIDGRRISEVIKRNKRKATEIN